jgi:hypothetical protein
LAWFAKGRARNLLKRSSHTASAAFNEAASVAYVAQTVDGGHTVDYVINDDLDNPRLPLGMAMPKDKPELHDALQAALQHIVDHDANREIMGNVNIEALAIDKVTVNCPIH